MTNRHHHHQDDSLNGLGRLIIVIGVAAAFAYYALPYTPEGAAVRLQDIPPAAFGGHDAGAARDDGRCLSCRHYYGPSGPSTGAPR